MPLRILWISSVCPYPLTDGNRHRQYHLLREVARRHRVTLLCPAGPGDAVEGLEGIGAEVLTVPDPRGGAESLSTRARRRIRSLGSRSPGCFLPESLPEIQRVAGGVTGFDLAYGSLYVAPALFAAGARTTVLDDQNVEEELYRRVWKRERPGLRKLSRLLDWWAVSGYEPACLERADAVTVCSERDRRILLEGRRRLPPVHVVPNGVDLSAAPRARADRYPDSIVMVGGMSYTPNVDGACFLVRQVMPRVWRRRPAARVCLVGKDPSPDVLALAGPRVTVTGTVPDVRPYLDRASVAVVPLRCGGGTRIKLLESMAAGVPVVSTSLGAEGLGLRDGEEIYLADTAAEASAALLHLLSEPAAAARMAANARRRVERDYGWAGIGSSLSDLLAGVACPRETAGSPVGTA